MTQPIMIWVQEGQKIIGKKIYGGGETPYIPYVLYLAYRGKKEYGNLKKLLKSNKNIQRLGLTLDPITPQQVEIITKKHQEGALPIEEYKKVISLQTEYLETEEEPYEIQKREYAENLFQDVFREFQEIKDVTRHYIYTTTKSMGVAKGWNVYEVNHVYEEKKEFSRFGTSMSTSYLDDLVSKERRYYPDNGQTYYYYKDLFDSTVNKKPEGKGIYTLYYTEEYNKSELKLRELSHKIEEKPAHQGQEIMYKILIKLSELQEYIDKFVKEKELNEYLWKEVESRRKEIARNVEEKLKENLQDDPEGYSKIEETWYKLDTLIIKIIALRLVIKDDFEAIKEYINILNFTVLNPEPLDPRIEKTYNTWREESIESIDTISELLWERAFKETPTWVDIIQRLNRIEEKYFEENFGELLEVPEHVENHIFGILDETRMTIRNQVGK